MKSVQVLLSTYNGEKYLREQLDSILNQDYPNFSILIRDDGSSDNTLKILEDYANKYEQITYYAGCNIGVKESFFDLIRNADKSADFYSFSDQDDVWLDNKISSAVKQLNNMNQNKPLLYCGGTTLVDQTLKPIYSTIKSASIIPGFGNALVENICTGCTCVINNVLLLLIQSHIPDFTVMHDWWLYLTASCYGEVFYDDIAYILYRQHNNNVVGIRSNYYTEFKNRFKNFKSNRGQLSRQAKEFERLYDISKENRELLELVIGAKNNVGYRISIFIMNKIYRQRKMDNVIFKGLFLFGKT